MFDLVDIKLAKVFNIHTNLTAVGNCGNDIKLQIRFYFFDGLNDIGKLSYATGLDNNTVGIEF